MPTLEKRLIDQIKETEVEKANVISRIRVIKRTLDHAETELISCKLRQESLIDQLRVHRASIVDRNLTPREIEIERFRIASVEILKKL